MVSNIKDYLEHMLANACKDYICLKHRLLSNKNLQANEFIFENSKEFDCLAKPD